MPEETQRAETDIMGLPIKPYLNDSDVIVIQAQGEKSYRFTVAQFREYLRVGALSPGILYYSQSPLETDNPGAVKAWTGVYEKQGADKYKDFYAWLKRHPELCTTKAVYDFELKEYGQTHYYVLDEDTGSIRFPVYSRFIAGVREDGGRGVYKDQMQDFKTVFKFNKSMMLGGSVSGAGTIKKAWDNYHGLDSNGQEHITEMEIRPSADSTVRAGDEGYPAHQREYPWIFVYNAVANSSLIDVKVIMADVLRKLETSNIKAASGIAVDVSELNVTFRAAVDSQTIKLNDAGQLQAVAVQTNLGPVTQVYLTQAEYDALPSDDQVKAGVEYNIFADEVAA